LLEEEIVSKWMEDELRSQMRPVAAPEALWDKVQHARTQAKLTGKSRPSSSVRPLWFMPVCAAMLVLMTAGLLWGIRQSRGHLRDRAPLTDQELRVLADNSLGESYSSDNPAQIRNWVKSRSSIDIEMPSSRSEAIHLLGAKIVQLHGSLIAAVAYKVGLDSATLLVSRQAECCNAGASSRHLISRTETAAGIGLASWNMREQTYTIAYTCSGEPQGACQLCHADARNRL
jgi:hypothetical protein